MCEQEEGLTRFTTYLCQRVAAEAAESYSRLVEAPGVRPQHQAHAAV